jgi:hypothetical protein
MQQITAAKKSAPFINLSKDEMSVQIVQHVQKIHSMLGDDYKCVAFTVGVEATVLVEAIQLHEGVILGGASPKHFVRDADQGIDEVRELLGRDANGENSFVLAKEIKIAVVLFQDTPTGKFPYFTLAGLPKTVNKSNVLGKKDLVACLDAANGVRNVAILNQTTNGVSCEVQWNLESTLTYLDVSINHVLLPDSNHNINYLRYQLLGGSSAACIGSYVFDPELTTMAGVALDLVHVSNFCI